MIFDRWDVALARFPFADIRQDKLRPVLVLSSSAYTRFHDLAIVAMITTAVQSRWPTDHPIADIRTAGLSRACVVRFKLATLATSLMGARVGSIAERERAEITQALATILPSGLSPPA